MPTDSEIEIRQFFEPEDFGDALTPELHKLEQPYFTLKVHRIRDKAYS